MHGLDSWHDARGVRYVINMKGYNHTEFPTPFQTSTTCDHASGSPLPLRELSFKRRFGLVHKVGLFSMIPSSHYLVVWAFE